MAVHDINLEQNTATPTPSLQNDLNLGGVVMVIIN